MLEVAASPAYKDLMDALGKLAEWSEQAGKGDLPSGQPPEDLVRQFNEALGGTPVEAAQRADASGLPKMRHLRRKRSFPKTPRSTSLPSPICSRQTKNPSGPPTMTRPRRSGCLKSSAARSAT